MHSESNESERIVMKEFIDKYLKKKVLIEEENDDSYYEDDIFFFSSNTVNTVTKNQNNE